MKVIVKHAYMRTRTGGLLFYSVRDCLVFFTLFCTIARKYSVRVLAVCLMYDHVHILVEVRHQKQLTALVRDCTSRYARAFNMSSGRTGQVFDKSFGYAPKTGGKKIRTAIAYVYNNPVEKKLVRRAEEFKWNLLAYHKSSFPFSKPIDRKCARKPMRRALSEVDAARSSDRPMSYAQLARIMEGLDAEELKQLTDYIITSYNCVDYDAVAAHYSSFEDMLTAIHSNTGSEYDIKEISTKGDDRVYRQMSRALAEHGNSNRGKRVISLPVDEKRELSEMLRGYTLASEEQVEKYLWIGTRRLTRRSKKAGGA